MLNIDDFNKRLEFLLEYYGVSASIFADRIGIQRSGMSHLMSGRNKPSLDFVMKIIESFPEVDLYWLLSGKGEFPKNDDKASPAPALLQEIIIPTNDVIREDTTNNVFTEPEEKQLPKKEMPEPDLFSVPQNNELAAAVEVPKEVITEEAQPVASPQPVAPSVPGISIPQATENDIDRIVIFYRNGSFKSYTPGN